MENGSLEDKSELLLIDCVLSEHKFQLTEVRGELLKGFDVDKEPEMDCWQLCIGTEIK